MAKEKQNKIVNTSTGASSSGIVQGTEIKLQQILPQNQKNCNVRNEH